MNTDRLRMIEEMLEKNPGDSFLNYAAALEFNKNGDKEKAIAIIEKLLVADSNYLAAYYQLGKLYESTNNAAKAIGIYKQGKIIAQQQNDTKTLGELNEALLILTDDEMD